MEDVPRDELARLVAEYGPGLAEEPRRVRALLRDCCGEYKAEIAALSAAGEEGAGTALLQASAGVADATAERLAQTLIEDRALNAEAARWAVAAWARALGIGLTSFAVSAPPDDVPQPSATRPAAPPPPAQPPPVRPPDPPGQATIAASGPPQTEAGRTPPAPGAVPSGAPPSAPAPPTKQRHSVRTAIIGTVVVVGGLSIGGALLGDQDPGPATTTRVPQTTTIFPNTTTRVEATESLTVYGETRTLTVGVPDGWEGIADDSDQSLVWIALGYVPFDVAEFGVADDRDGATFFMFSLGQQDDTTVQEILDTAFTVPGCDPFVGQGMFESGDFRYAYANAPCQSGGFIEIAVLYEPQSPFYALVYTGRAFDDIEADRLVVVFDTIRTSS